MSAQDGQGATQEATAYVGAGRDETRPENAVGFVSVADLASFLNGLPSRREDWFTLNEWAGHSRGKEVKGPDCLCSSWGVAVDIDGPAKTLLAPADRTTFEAAVRAGALPGSFAYATAGGFRVVFVFDRACTDFSTWLEAARGANVIVGAALVELRLADRFTVDDDVTTDPKRIFYSPKAIVPRDESKGAAPGQARSGEALVMREARFTVADLAQHAPKAEAKPAQATRSTPVVSPGLRRLTTGFTEAKDAFNAANPLELDESVGSRPCPGCGDTGCAHLHPDNPGRAVCFNTDHDPAKHGGRQADTTGTPCVTFDSLDVHAARAGLEPDEFLRQQGLRGGSKTSVPATSSSTPKTPGNDPVPATQKRRRTPGMSFAVDLWRGEEGLRVHVLGSGELEFNEMLHAPTVGRVPFDADAAEATMRDLADRHLDAILGIEVTHTALFRVAHERRYHPVREYLATLVWDEVPRIGLVADQVLRLPAEDDLSRELLHRWFVAAAARVLQPGCKVDNVLILVGRQGVGKSTFFDILGGPFYADVHADLARRYTDGLLMLHGTWVAEWAELATMRRAESGLVKQVISQRADRLRPPYGRSVIELPRSFVIVGTTNEDEFLSDDTGNRRFWVIDLRHLQAGDQIDKRLLEEIRDQVWAEAVARYRTGESWWLPQKSEARLAERHREHTESDPWAHTVLEVADALGKVEIAQLLHAVKPDSGPGGWTKADQMRIAGILRRDGYHLTRPLVEGRRLRVWAKYRPVPTYEPEVGTGNAEESQADDPMYRPDRPLLGKKKVTGRG